MHTGLGNPSIYMPDQSPELTASEIPHIKAALSASITEIDNIKSRVDAPRQSLDVATLLHVSRYTSAGKANTLALNYDNNFMYNYLSPDYLFFLSFETAPLCYAVPVKIPLPNPRIQLHLHPQTFLRRNTQRQQRKWMYTKKALHSLAIQCVRRTNTGSDFICTRNQPAESSHSSQTTPCGNLMPDHPAISRTLRQRLSVYRLKPA